MSIHCAPPGRETACHNPLTFIYTSYPYSYSNLAVIATTRFVRPRHASGSRGVSGDGRNTTHTTQDPTHVHIRDNRDIIYHMPRRPWTIFAWVQRCARRTGQAMRLLGVVGATVSLAARPGVLALPMVIQPPWRHGAHTAHTDSVQPHESLPCALALSCRVKGMPLLSGP